MDNIACVDANVKVDRCMHLKLISKELGILYGSVYDIIHNSLRYRKVSCLWVPELLYDLNKTRMMTSLQHLQRYSKESERFLELIGTGDETWILHVLQNPAEHDVEASRFACQEEILQDAIHRKVDAHGLEGSPRTTLTEFHATRCHHQCRQLL
jgi:hypothetical protein